MLGHERLLRWPEPFNQLRMHVTHLKNVINALVIHKQTHAGMYGMFCSNGNGFKLSILNLAIHLRLSVKCRH